MRFGFLIMALIVMVFAGATPVALIKAQQPRTQEGLTPGQKRAVSKYDPADFFGPAGEESRGRGAAQGNRQQRRGTPTPTPSSPPQRQSTTSAGTQPSASQTPATSTQQPAVATPSATIPAPTILAAGLQQPPLNKEDSSGKIDSRWAAAILIFMALIVSAALIFTLSKLFEKIRESSSG